LGAFILLINHSTPTHTFTCPSDTNEFKWHPMTWRAMAARPSVGMAAGADPTFPYDLIRKFFINGGDVYGYRVRYIRI